MKKMFNKMSNTVKTMTCKARAIPYRIKSYYVEGGFSHLIHMTAAHLW